MDYALIENDIVINIIWLHPMNAHEFPNAVPINNLPVKINDSYIDGKFYRNEVEVFPIDNISESELEEIRQEGYEQALLDLAETIGGTN